SSDVCSSDLVENAAQVTTDAFALAQAQRIPVLLFIPHDIAAAPAQEETVVAPEAPVVPSPDEILLAQAAQLLTGAERPLILAGRGARDAVATLGDIADAIGALTTTSAPARGTFSGRPYDLGVCGGFASEPSAEMIRSADVVLAVGAGLNQFRSEERRVG